MDREDQTFRSLLRRAMPLLITPPGRSLPSATRLRGVVRPDHDHARVVFCNDAEATSGVAYEFSLTGPSSDDDLIAAAAIDWARSRVGHSAGNPAGSKGDFDSHGNLVVNAVDAGYFNSSELNGYDQNLLSLLTVMIHGGGRPWFEGTLSLAGFMLIGANTCRIYVHEDADGETHGIQIPLSNSHGKFESGFGGSLPQELMSLITSDNLRFQPIVDDSDDYCDVVFDMTQWVDPSAPDA